MSDGPSQELVTGVWDMPERLQVWAVAARARTFAVPRTMRAFTGSAIGGTQIVTEDGVVIVTESGEIVTAQ